MSRGSRVRVAVWLPLLVVFSYGYFYNATNWNHISRFDAIFSFVEPGTPDQHSFRVDHFIVNPLLGRNTGDWARSPLAGEHLYSNKAPGLMLLGVPIYAGIYAVESALGAVPESQAWTRINTYLLNLALTVLPAALAALCFFQLLRTSSGLGEGDALGLTLVLFFCTAMLPYATQFWGHVSVAAFSVMALYFLHCGERGGFVLSGFFAGLAVLSEYSAAISLVSIVVLLAAERRWRALLGFGLGGLPTFLAYVLYHHGAFGSWLAVANSYNNPKFLDPGRIGGVFGALEPEAIWGLSFSPHHGLFFFMPVLLLVIPACFLLQRGPGRNLRLLCLGNIVGFFGMNLFFNGWHGGFCLGPRYLIPSFPFYVLLLPPLIVELRARGRAFVLPVSVLALVSAANMAVLAMHAPSTTFMEDRNPNPLALHYRSLLGGELGEKKLSPLRLDGDWRVGGEVVSSRNNHLALAGAKRAESVIRLNRAGSVRFQLGWQGALEISVNGEKTRLAEHVHFEHETVERKLAQGENEIVLSWTGSPGEDRLFVVAFASQGRPRLPRPTAETPEFALGGSNLGHWLGLEQAASVLPWLLGSAGLAVWLLRRSYSSAPT